MLNYYQLLETVDFADEQTVKKAYRQKCKEYHPDQVRTLGPKLQKVAEREMSIINRAFGVIGDNKRKKRYDEWLARARSLNEFKPCPKCGLQYVPRTDRPEDNDLCPICSDQNCMDDLPDSITRDPNPISDLEILRACFVVMFHFSTASVTSRVTPFVELVISGEKMRVTGPPGALEIVIENREIYNMVQPGPDVLRTPWNFQLKRGKIVIHAAHPSEAAERLLNFIRQVCDDSIHYCRICIEDREYLPYEHILNQSVLIALRKLSPWTASKLCTRHQRNLRDAISDPETFNDDAFFTVIAAGREDDAKSKLSIAESEIKKLKQELKAAKENSQTASGRVQKQTEVIDQLCTQIKENANLRAAADQKESTLKLLQSRVQELRAQVKNLQKENSIIPKLYSRNIELETAFRAVQHDSFRIEQMKEQIEQLKSDSRQLAQKETMIARLAAQVDELKSQNKKLQQQNTLIVKMNEKISQLEVQNRDLQKQNDLITRLSRDMEETRDVMAIAFETYSSYVPEKPADNVTVWDFVQIFENMVREIQTLRGAPRTGQQSVVAQVAAQRKRRPADNVTRIRQRPL